MLRKLEPGLVAMYSRSSVLMTSIMKSLPGRSMTMSPVGVFSFFFSFLPSVAGASCFAASGDCATTVVAAVAPRPAAADLRKSLRSMRSLLLLVCQSIYHWDWPQERRSTSRNMQSKIMPLADAIAAHVKDGMTVAMEGFTHLIPFAA